MRPKYTRSSSHMRLIAIDLGLKSGMATYGPNGLVAYRATRFPSKRAIKEAAWSVLYGVDGLQHVFVEGDRGLAVYWKRAAEQQGLSFQSVAPERWREALLLPRERRSAAEAKRSARRHALTLIRESDAPLPKGPLTSDVAEAILIAHWGARSLGWSTQTAALSASPNLSLKDAH